MSIFHLLSKISFCLKMLLRGPLNFRNNKKRPNAWDFVEKLKPKNKTLFSAIFYSGGSSTHSSGVNLVHRSIMF